ncbi:MAG TPA: MFS transporter [Tepidisphaeraceae bacterium]|jgi:MFS family permease|nr:MFS transporter [Tepidisphaeraceae bacterium]
MSTALPLAKRDYSIWQVIAASSAGTVIEWYDFYIFGSLYAIVAPLFFPKGNQFLAQIAYLAIFAAGFIVRPFGALFFGRIGDLVGRKYAFLVTLLIMGCSTALIGLLPTYATIGIAAPIILLLIRILQGLAIGGEYGGAAIYVAEHVPDHRRGFYTSFIQITATLGLFVSLGVILIVQSNMDKASFASWGWRIPFLLSIILVIVSLYMRLRMKESPIFSQLKNEGKTSTAPIRDALMAPGAFWRIALTLFGATAGQAVVWYTGQFYALYFLQTILKVETRTANLIVAAALLIGMPFFVIFGALSDRIGRKKLMMAGCLLAAISYVPIYHHMTNAAGNNVYSVEAIKDPVTGNTKLTPMTPRILPDLANLPDTDMPNLKSPPVPAAPLDLIPASPATHPNVGMLIFLIFLQVLFVTMVYGPIAAYLVEAFPAKIRYTSLSLPYHIGNGVFGGLLPVISLSACAYTGNIYAGLAYPIAIAIITFAIGTSFLTETRHIKIWDEIS